MGALKIETWGSFPKEAKGAKVFRAQEAGHAQAVAAAIRYLSEIVLPGAIKLDHKLQKDGVTPDDAQFGEYPG